MAKDRAGWKKRAEGDHDHRAGQEKSEFTEMSGVTSDPLTDGQLKREHLQGETSIFAQTSYS